MGGERAIAAGCKFRHYFDLVERRLALAAPLVATWLSRAALLTGPAVGSPRRRLSSPVLFKFLTIATNALVAIVKNLNKTGELRRSEEHTSELQSRQYLVCRLLLEKKKKKKKK